MTLLKKEAFILYLSRLCLKGANCCWGNMDEDEKALRVGDMLSAHLGLHFVLFLLSQNLRLVTWCNTRFVPHFPPHTFPVSFNSPFLLLHSASGWGNPVEQRSCSFLTPFDKTVYPVHILLMAFFKKKFKWLGFGLGHKTHKDAEW